MKHLGDDDITTADGVAVRSLRRMDECIAGAFSVVADEIPALVIGPKLILCRGAWSNGVLPKWAPCANVTVPVKYGAAGYKVDPFRVLEQFTTGVAIWLQTSIHPRRVSKHDGILKTLTYYNWVGFAKSISSTKLQAQYMLSDT
jgi:hypothetical protein